MARQFGKAGASARQAARGRYLKVCLYAALLLAAPIILHFKTNSSAQFSGLVGTVAAFCIAGVLRLLLGLLHTEAAETVKRAKDANREARAEEEAALQLSNLPATCFAFHDIAFKEFSIDHLVVSPAGVFVIATKTLSGIIEVKQDTLLLNGELTSTNLVQEVCRQTEDLQEYLWKMTSQKWLITPVICFTTAHVQVAGPVKGVHVLALNDLKAFFQSQPAILGTTDIERILRVLKYLLQKQRSPLQELMAMPWRHNEP